MTAVGVSAKGSDVQAAEGYAGDIAPSAAWRLLEQEQTAVLVDVRTDAEWNYVGLPDLSRLNKAPVLLAWQVYPSMTVNPAFVEQLRASGAANDAAILFLCRSGVRSKAAAQAATRAGFARAYNISDGFEGPVDAHRHRGAAAGWKASGLPWMQK